MKLLILAPFLLASVAAHAGPIYLNCEILSAPDYQRFSSQTQRDDFVTEAFMHGMAGYVVSPSATWVVDLENGQVRSPEDGDRSTVRNLQVTEGKIRGITESGSVFDLNRVSLKLSYTKFLGEKGPTLQGITIPATSIWNFQCTAARNPAV